MKTSRLAVVAGTVAVGFGNCATVLSQNIEQIVVVGDRIYPANEIVAPAAHQAIDTAELLQQIPGANVNANGALTGIAQYRGLYGDRVAISIDGLGTLSGGPNAMDTPLSYASPLLLEHLSLERGIASVSNSLESLGGHIDATYDRGSYASNADFSLGGSVQARYESNGSTRGIAARLVGANDRHKITLLAEQNEADDFTYPGGTLFPTRLNRQHSDLSYSFHTGDSEFTVFAGKMDTEDTGTPALPMDIDFIDTQLGGFQVRSAIGKTALDIAVSYSDVDHRMTNFALRTPPASPMAYRATRALADGYRWRAGTQTTLGSGELKLGLDGESATHNATITNPNAAPFLIENFDDAQRDLLGIYGQWNQLVGTLDIEAGVRLNRVSLDSGTVGASIPTMNPMMQMMGMNAALLANDFNSGTRGRDHDNVDVVLKVGRVLNDTRSVYAEVARKSRAPSYQEAFLWLPLQSTGGLADGRSYIGNPNLASEVSREINIGTDWRGEKAWFGPQLFFKKIDDYIQGTPTTNTTANMVAMMMTGLPALEFTNTQAEVYGIDFAWGYSINSSMSVQGVLTYVRGKRTDVKDDLYRLAPFNGTFSVVMDKPDWTGRIELVAYAEQKHVAAYNNELASAGYGLVNARLRWRAGEKMNVFANIENLLDKTYAAHLSGINRVANSSIPVGDRLFGLERNLNIGVSFDW